MPGLLDSFSGSAGLLSGLRQIAGGPGYGSGVPQSGVMGALQQIGGMPSEEDRREYEALRARGYTGTFEEFVQEKRKRMMPGMTGQPRGY